MSERSPRPSRPWWDTPVFGAALAAGLIAATLVMFSAFMYYDDEGYVLVSLKNFIAHGGLYRDVYTQYGPFPFVVHLGLHSLGLPLTHTTGRLLTLLAWAGTAVACAALAGYATRSALARLATLVGVFVYLWVMASEPSHPGGLIVLLSALLAAFGYRWILRDRLPRWSILTGAVIGALLLTKINVGVFAAFSAVAWWLLHHRDTRLRRWAPLLVGLAGVVLPVGLMRPLLDQPWVQTYALLFAGAALSLAAVASRHASGFATWRNLGTGGLAAAAVMTAVAAVVLLRGTTPRDLLDGLVLGPLRQPTSFSLRFLWPPGIGIAALLSLAGCVSACLLRRRAAAAVDGTIAGLRLVAAAGLAITLARFPIVAPDYETLGGALPCLWLFAWPLAGEKPAVTAAHLWVILLLLGQSLHAFPVPGSQIAWGTVLTVPVAAVGAWDAARWLAARVAGGAFAAPTLTRVGSALVVVLTAAVAVKFGQVALRYREGQNLGLPGAELIRVPDNSAALTRILTHNAALHADVLFTFPGMFSFNLWSGVPTPTLANVTHWFSLLSQPRQQAIIAALESHPRACVIIHREHLDFLAKRNLAARGILADYIAQHFEPAFAIDGVEFCVRRGRQIRPFLVADVFTRQTGADAGAKESTLLQLTTLLPEGSAIAAIEVATGAEPLRLTAANARIEVAPADSRGEPVGPARAATWPLQVSRAAILSIYFDRESLPRPVRGATVILRDPAGEAVALARLRP